MLLNFLTVVIFAFGCQVIGLSIRKVLDLKKYFFLDIPIGLSTVAFISTVMYFLLNIPVWLIKYILIGMVCMTFLYVAKDIKKKEIKSFFIMLFIMILLSIPGLVNGDQYYAWRGNAADHFFYTSAAMTVNENTAYEYVNGTATIPNDLIEYGSEAVFTDRPTVSLLFSILMTSGKGELFWHIYVFHCFLLASIILPLFKLADVFLEKTCKITSSGNSGGGHNVVPFVVSVTFLFGFWGQLLYDINAWSQLGSTAINVAIVVVAIEWFNNIFEDRDIQIKNRKLFLLLTILLTGSFAIYAENAIVHFFLISGMFIFTALAEKRKVKKKDVLSIGVCFLIVVLLNSIANWRVIRFAWGQLTASTWGSSQPKPWWRFFDNYWTGFWNSGDYFAEKIVCFIPSFFGYSFAMPNMSLDLWIRVPWIICTLILTVAIIALIFFITIYKLFKGDILDKLLASCVFTGLCGTAFFLPFLKLWESGKMMTYISPYLYLAMLLPIFCYPQFIKKVCTYTIVCAASVLLLINVAFSFYGYSVRVGNERGNGLGGAFPSDQLPQIKEMTDFDYNTDIIDRETSIVELEADNKWFLSYLKFKTYYAGVDYFVEKDTAFWYAEGTEKINEHVDTDAKVFLQKKNDGIKEVLIEPMGDR